MRLCCLSKKKQQGRQPVYCVYYSNAWQLFFESWLVIMYENENIEILEKKITNIQLNPNDR